MTKAIEKSIWGEMTRFTTRDTVYMQIVCFCFGFSFKIESTLEKMEYRIFVSVLVQIILSVYKQDLQMF